MDEKSISFSPPDISEIEIEEMIDTLKSGWIATGPKTKLFEQKIAEYVGVKKVACLNSATSALELTLRILGIGPGDEIITSAYTFTATAAVIEHVGAKIVLVDCAKDSYEMDFDKLSCSITKKTKAIIPVDIGGKICDYEKIYKIVEEKAVLFEANNEIQKHFNRIIIIADAAHSFGAIQDGRLSGNMADFSCFSFHAVKNLTTANGGAAVWRNDLGLDDEYIYNEFMKYSMHGQSKDALDKSESGSWEYDIVYPGYKYNFIDILAALGLAQLKRIKGFLQRRKEIIEMYDERFLPLGIKTLQHFGKEYSSSGHLYMIRIPGIDEKTRNEIISKMAEKKIMCNVHFKPLPMMTAYRNMGFDIKDYPNTYNQYANEITLPLYTLLSDNDVNYVCDCLKNTLSELKII